MKKHVRNNRGQFIVIAVLLVSIMIVAIAGILHSAATYYKHEPWEEYSTLISDIELNTRRLVEQGLAEYTRTGNIDVLNNSLSSWRRDIARTYPEKGITLDFNLANGPIAVYVQPLVFNGGLAKKWDGGAASSSARANFSLTIASIGLSGYTFTAESLLKLSMTYDSNKVVAVVYGDNNIPISDLQSANFRINNQQVQRVNFTARYDSTVGAVTYTIDYQGTQPPMVEVWDSRNIRVVAFQN